jgi:hypothetical protein
MTATTPVPTRARARREKRSRRRLALVVAGLGIVPFVVMIASLFTDRMSNVPTFGDTALLELTIRDVGHRMILLGPYSRFHWHHPGPLMFDWLAIPYRLFGADSTALNQGSALTAGIAVGIAAWVTFRRGAIRLLAWAMFVVGVLVWTLGPEVFRKPWNPWITVLPLLAMLLLAWDTTAGGYWSFPFAVALGSFIVQSHIGYAAVTIAILGGTAIIVVGQAVRELVDWPRVLTIGLVAFGAFLVLWSPALYQEVRDEPGNLTQLQRFFSDTRTEHTIGDGIDVTFHELGAVPAQFVKIDTGSGQEGRPPAWAGVLTLLALGASVVVALIRRAWSAVALAGLVALSILAAAWSMARVIGAIEPYLVIWIAGCGAAAWIALGAACFAPGERAGVRFPVRVLVAAVVAISLLNCWNGWRALPPEPIGALAVPPLTSAVRPALGPPEDGPVLVRSRGFAAWVLAAAVMIDLQRRGYDTVVDPKEGWLLGEQRVRGPGQKVASVLTFADPVAAELLSKSPNQRLLGRETALQDVSVFLET